MTRRGLVRLRHRRRVGFGLGQFQRLDLAQLLESCLQIACQADQQDAARDAGTQRMIPLGAPW